MSRTLHRPGRVLAATLCLVGFAVAGCSSQQSMQTTTRAEERAAGSHSGRGTPPLGTAPGHLGPGTGGKRIMVVGDSWAANLAQGMSAVASQHTSVVNAGLGGCGIRLPKGNETPARCREWPKKWPSYLRTFRPDATVLMVGYWDVEPQRVNAHENPKDLTSPAARAAFAKRLDQAVDLLTGSGKPVYLMTSPLVADSPYRESARVMNQVLRQVDQNRVHVKILDVAGQLCNESSCPKVIDGISVYDPTRHLTSKARDRIATWALNTVFPGAES
ncbi:SGNH hydrolase domain-containing protein [Streptomyces sp. NPDC007205]|uniref:DUF459 domain-containing protein n=1 Tax=Streptomyces sp. NPDC007205 TaxID=3154316 RepID=UPI0033C7067A